MKWGVNRPLHRREELQQQCSYDGSGLIGVDQPDAFGDGVHVFAQHELERLCRAPLFRNALHIVLGKPQHLRHDTTAGPERWVPLGNTPTLRRTSMVNSI